MAEKTAQDKTEAATPRRRTEAKEEGNVARSVELNSVAVLFAGILALQFTASEMIDRMARFMIATYQNAATTAITPTSLPIQVSSTARWFVSALAPVLLFIVFAGIGVNYAQIGVVFAKKALIPKFDRINPLKGFQRLFSLRSVVEIAKGMIKIGIVGFIGYSVLKKHLDEYWLLSHVSTGQIFVFIAVMLFELSVKIGLALIILAVADFAYQRWEYQKNLKMTKQEVKEEQKQYEGNPEIRGRIKSVQRQMARRRMMAAVPDATVVVTNPTHVAVALRYAPVAKTDAPAVVAKGKRKIAEKIKEIAVQNDVPIVENEPLARSLFDTTEVGMEIPVILYQAVAEILAQVYRMNRGAYPLPAGYSYA